MLSFMDNMLFNIKNMEEEEKKNTQKYTIRCSCIYVFGQNLRWNSEYYSTNMT